MTTSMSLAKGVAHFYSSKQAIPIDAYIHVLTGRPMNGFEDDIRVDLIKHKVQ